MTAAVAILDRLRHHLPARSRRSRGLERDLGYAVRTTATFTAVVPMSIPRYVLTWEPPNDPSGGVELRSTRSS